MAYTLLPKLRIITLARVTSGKGLDFKNQKWSRGIRQKNNNIELRKKFFLSMN